MNKYIQLKEILKKLHDLKQINMIMSWDESVIMPKGSGIKRKEYMATLDSLQHEILTNANTKKLILDTDEDSLLDPWDKKNYQLIRKMFIKSSCLPNKLVEDLTSKKLECTQKWQELREKNNWNDFIPYLQKVLELTKQSASIMSQELNMDPYDVLLDSYSPGITQEFIDPIFSELQKHIVPLINSIQKKQNKKITLDKKFFPQEKQEELCKLIMKRMGFDFNNGRLDTSYHPFCGGAVGDIRITTRYDENNFLNAIMAVCHETGHAMYENNLPAEWITQPIGQSGGMCIHESQSLLVEMFFCRTKEFIEYVLSCISKIYPEIGRLDINDIYNKQTHVEPGYIRVYADEVTYPMHVVFRYEIEKQLIHDQISLNELPEVWDHYMTSLLGLSTKDNYKDGVMQDIHWPMGAFGYFPSYTIGALFAAQQNQQIMANNKNAKEELRNGNFSSIFKWMNNNIHIYGSFYNTNELIEKSTNQELKIDDFIKHISSRYSV